MNRQYQSPEREQAKQETRERILDALVEVVTREGVLAFTVQNVANAAGVSHRTVYRHFATREDLLDGLDELLERRGMAAGVHPGPPDLTDLPQHIGRYYESFDVAGDAMRAYVIISLALGRRVPGFDERSQGVRDHLARAYPGLTADELQEATGVIRVLLSTRAWFIMTTELHMSTPAAGRAASWALEALFTDLSARSQNRTP
jgi:AcrR family transcriptional regulator